MLEFAFCINVYAEDIKTKEIGSTAPDFNLPGVDGKHYSLASFKDASVKELSNLSK